MDNPDMQQRVTDIQDMRVRDDTDIAGNEKRLTLLIFQIILLLLQMRLSHL